MCVCELKDRTQRTNEGLALTDRADESVVQVIQAMLPMTHSVGMEEERELMMPLVNSES